MDSKTITLRGVYGKVKEYHLQPGKQQNGMNFPFVKPVRYNSDGSFELIMSEAERNNPESRYYLPDDLDIVITDGTTFNLEDPFDYNKWMSIKGSELIVPTRDARDANGDLIIDGNSRRYGVAELYVEIPGEESERSVSKKKLITRAWTFIENDSERGRLTKCKLLGKEMRNAPSSDVQEFLYDTASRRPEEIIELYTSSDTQLKLLVLDAKTNFVINKKNGLWMYGETALGATDDAILLYLKDPGHKRLFDMLKYEVYPEFAALNKAPEATKEVTTAVPFDTAETEEKPKKTTKK